jgi:hypothetical protein
LKQVFYLSVFGIFWWGTNATWNGLRSKLSPEHLSHQQFVHMPPPATPHRHPSANMYVAQTPYGSFYQPQFLQPGPDPGASAVPSAAERDTRLLELG